jgi:hypothetical protein
MTNAVRTKSRHVYGVGADAFTKPIWSSAIARSRSAGRVKPQSTFHYIYRQRLPRKDGVGARSEAYYSKTISIHWDKMSQLPW